jgi:hypothetical protein
MKSLAEQLTCAKRELALRRNAYPKWVKAQKMRQSTCDHELECMEAIVATLDRQLTLEQVSNEMLKRATQPVPVCPPVEKLSTDLF